MRRFQQEAIGRGLVHAFTEAAARLIVVCGFKDIAREISRDATDHWECNEAGHRSTKAVTASRLRAFDLLEIHNVGVVWAGRTMPGRCCRGMRAHKAYYEMKVGTTNEYAVAVAFG